MSAQDDLLVAGVGLWLPGVPDVEAWQAGARGVSSRDEEFPKATGASIDRRSRRRASPLSRAVADAFSTAAQQAQIDVETTGTVFGSGLGEVTTMLSLLDQISNGEELSPMSFATSVHSAAAGVISISSKNRGFTTSISAYADTPGAALFEARAVLESMNTPVVVTCSDENSPERFVADEDAFDTVAAAVALVPDAGDAPILARLRGPHREGATLQPVELPPALGRNPQVGMLDLVAAILAGQRGSLSLDRGRGSGWCVTIADPHE